MKYLTLASVILAGAPAAFADGTLPDYPQPNQSTLTRAEVIAEWVAARNQGIFLDGELYAGMPSTTGPSQPRAEIRAELYAALAAHKVVDGEGRHLFNIQQ